MKISIRDTEKLADAINAAQTHCKERLINVTDVQKAVEVIQKRLDETLFKKDQYSLVFDVDLHHQSFSSKYRYSAHSTHFTLEKTKSGWFVIDVSRDYCRDSRFFICKNIETKKEELLSFALKNFHKETVLPL